MLVGQRDAGHVLVCQLHEPVAVIANLGQVGAALVAGEAVLLDGLDVILVPDPDIELCLLKIHQRGVLLRRDRAGAEGQVAVVEVHVGLLAQLPAFGQQRGLVGEQHPRLSAFPEVEILILGCLLCGVERSVEGNPVALLVEIEAAEGGLLLAGQHRLGFAGGGIVHEEAAHRDAVLFLRLGHVGHPFAVPVKMVGFDTLQRIYSQRLDVQDINRGLDGRLVGLGAVFGRFFFFRFFGLFPLFGFAFALLALRRGGLHLFFLEGNPVAQHVAGLEVDDILELLDLAGFQVDHGDGALGALIGFLLVDLGLAGLLERRGDAIDRLGGVGGNHGAGGAVNRVGLAALYIV